MEVKFIYYIVVDFLEFHGLFSLMIIEQTDRQAEIPTNRKIIDRLYFKFTHLGLDHTCEQNFNYIKCNIAVDISNYDSRGKVCLE